MGGGVAHYRRHHPACQRCIAGKGQCWCAFLSSSTHLESDAQIIMNLEAIVLRSETGNRLEIIFQIAHTLVVRPRPAPKTVGARAAAFVHRPNWHAGHTRIGTVRFEVNSGHHARAPRSAGRCPGRQGARGAGRARCGCGRVIF